MPRRRGAGERKLERALEALCAALGEASVAWMVIGGIAIIARGVRRMTTDIDAVIRGDETDVRTLLAVLARRRIVARIDDAEAFARETLVLLLRHEPTGVELDLSIGWTAFEQEAIAARTSARLGTVTAPMARAEDLVIFKALAARPKDVEDAITLLAIHDDIDLVRVRRRVRELAALADEPSLVAGLEAMIRAARPRRRRR